MTKLDMPNLTRRQALTGLGGLSFFVAMGANGLGLSRVAQAAGPFDPSPWVRIAPDGTVTIKTISEMGQGSSNAIPLILAEDMDADWSKVVFEWAPAQNDPFGWPNPRGGRDMSVTGSRAVMMYYPELRIIGAQVRKVLLWNAAQTWGVDAASLKTEPGVVINPANGARLTYGEIAANGKAPPSVPNVEKSELKPKKDFRLIGKDIPRRDVPLKVKGAATYAIDVRLPDMVYATALHSPTHGNQPERWNEAVIRALPGVIDTLRLPGGIAVVAKTFEQAMIARNTLEVVWTSGKTTGFDSRAAMETYPKIMADPSFKVTSIEAAGDADAAFSKAARTYEASYFSDYSYHAQMEPLNAVARFDGDKLEVWDGSQDIWRARQLLSKELNVPMEKVEVHQCYLGGGFGRRSYADYAVEAALIARAVKKPVKLIWTREEDIAHGMFRPQTFQTMKAALDTSGKVTAWSHAAVGDDGGAAFVSGGMKISPYYGVENRKLDLRDLSHGVRVKHWRAVAHNFNLFAIESFVDEMAVKEGVDPVEFRLKYMSPTPKGRAVIERVAQMSDWGKPRPQGRALGFAMSERSGSVGAGVVEVSLDRNTGKLRIHKVWLACDCGTIVTPEAAKANAESGIVYGISAALHEQITLRKGAVEQVNFGDYAVLRMSDMPEEMHVAFLDRDTPPTGVGEIGTPFVMPAIANAFARLTGKRIQHMPFTPERVKALLV